MVRKTIHLDAETARLVEQEARRRNVADDEVVRDLVWTALTTLLETEPPKTGDPFLDDHAVFEGPPDLIENLEAYLYGQDESE